MTLASQLHASAQAEAQSLVGFDEDHESILSSSAVFKKLAAELDKLEASEASGARARASRTVTFELVDADRFPESRLAPGAPLQADPRIQIRCIRLRGQGDDRVFGPGHVEARAATQRPGSRYDRGRLIFVGLQPGEYELQVEAVGYAPHVSQFRVSESGPSRSAVVRLAKASTPAELSDVVAAQKLAQSPSRAEGR